MEETFVNAGARSALQLGQARGVALMTPAAMGLKVGEYAANLVKKSVVGTGHAEKTQVQLMIKTLAACRRLQGRRRGGRARHRHLPCASSRHGSASGQRMIGKLKGLVDGFGDDFVHIDVGGVVYEAFCSSKTMASLPQVGHATVVHVEMIVREDMIRLYGFATPDEKAWFNTLMTVQGVGARVALSVLSTLSPSELSSAIALQDKAMVGRANGVGPKLATRLVTELKGKVPTGIGIDAGTLGLQAALGEGRAKSNVADAVSALSNLGYSKDQASAAVARVVSKEGEATETATLIRLGLRELSS